MKPTQIVKNIMRKKCMQPFWEFMLDVTLYGLNIGPASHPLYSGEKYLLGNVRRILKKKPDDEITVFDVGANQGDYAREVYAILGTATVIHCFEPSVETHNILKEKTMSMDAITLHNFGFSNKKETLELFSDMKGSGIASLYERRLDHQGTYLSNRETVRLSTLDSFCEENDIRKINLLKVDVEGHEYKVFEGASEMLGNNSVDMIQFEFGGCNIDSRTYLQDFHYLLNQKYRLFRLVYDGLAPMDKYNEKFEQFRTTNLIAIHRDIYAG